MILKRPYGKRNGLKARGDVYCVLCTIEGTSKKQIPLFILHNRADKLEFLMMRTRSRAEKKKKEKLVRAPEISKVEIISIIDRPKH